MKALSITRSDVTPEALLRWPRRLRARGSGVKIAAVLLVQAGHRPTAVTELFGISRTTLTAWVHRVNRGRGGGAARALPPGPAVAADPADPAPGRCTSRPCAGRVWLERARTGMARCWCGICANTSASASRCGKRKIGSIISGIGSNAPVTRMSKPAPRTRAVPGEPKKRCAALTAHETIVFEDETGFTLHPRLGRGWAKRGQRLRVATRSVHRKRLNLFGWVAPCWGDGACSALPRGTIRVSGALRHLRRMPAGYTVWVYVDRAGWHRGTK